MNTELLSKKDEIPKLCDQDEALPGDFCLSVAGSTR